MTSNDGFILISTEEQLRNIRNGDMNASYRLTNDIKLTSEWIPINNFSGTFDGNGFTIHDLNIGQASASENYRGLFGTTSNARIFNLTLNGGNIQGMSNIGSFIGQATGTLTLENCKSNVNVTGTGQVGGLVGHGYNLTDSEISRCEYSGKVSGSGDAGGIIGRLDGLGSVANNLISQCRVVINSSDSQATKNQTVRVTGGTGGTSTHTGGIAGRITYTNVTECYTGIRVEGSAHVGGVIGRLFGISSACDCYSTGDVYGSSSEVGGVAGCQYYQPNRIERCYSTSKVEGGYPVGGCVGYAQYGSDFFVGNNFAINGEIRSVSADGVGRISGMLAATSTSLVNNRALNTIPIFAANAAVQTVSAADGRHGLDVSDAELKDAKIYKDAGWDFENVWAFGDPKENPYPVLRFADNMSGTATSKCYLREISNGQRMTLSALSNASSRATITLKDDATTYLTLSKTDDNVAYTLIGTGNAVYNGGNNLRLEIEIKNSVQQVKIDQLTDCSMTIDDDGCIHGCTYRIAIEDWHDHDYNDFVVTIVVTNAK